MAKMTIAQLRECSLIQFNDSYIHDIEKARTIVRLYYLLARQDERLLYLDNDERMYNDPTTELLRIRRDHRHHKLSELLKPYGLRIVYYGFLPTIVTNNQKQALYVYFY